MNKFDKAQVGDKVYSLLHGYGVITEVSSPSRLITVDFNGNASNRKYYLDGKYQVNDYEPTLFWNRPLTPDDPAPKRKVKKTLVRYCNLYKAGGEVYASVAYSTQKLAHQAWQGVGPFTIVILKEQPITFEYEEEE